MATGIEGVLPVATTKKAISSVYAGVQGVRPLRTAIPSLPQKELMDTVEVDSAARRGTESASNEAADRLREIYEEEGGSPVDRVVEETNSRMQANNRSIRFRVSEYNDELQIQIVDRDNDKVIRSIPPDEMLRLASRMRELSGIGAMVDQSR